MNPIAALVSEQAKGGVGGRKSDAVYHAVRRAVLLGRLQPGTPLLEQRIAAAMGCAQGTVREALIRLEQDGLVVRVDHRGTFVSETSEAEALLMAQLRIRIETRAAAAVAAAGPCECFGRLEAILAEMSEAERQCDGYALSELDRSFHATVVAAAGLPALLPVLARCSLHVHRFIYAHAPAGRTPDNRLGLPSPTERHRALLDALRRGDGAQASGAVRAHIEEVIGSWAPGLLARLLEEGPVTGS